VNIPPSLKNILKEARIPKDRWDEYKTLEKWAK
jgi:uracil DNA glycosylase